MNSMTTVKSMKKFLLPLCLSAAFLVAPAGNAFAADPVVPTINVVGSAEKQINADYALLRLGISTMGSSVNEAKVKNDKIMSDLISRLAQVGVSKQEVQTANFSVNPTYAYNNANGTSPSITGYTISNTVAVKISDLKKVATVIDESAKAGANEINYLNFEANRSQALDDQLVEEAIKNARHKAEVIAKALGRTLGPIQSVNTYNNRDLYTVQRSDSFAYKASALSSTTPIEAGSLTAQKEVSITYTLL